MAAHKANLPLACRPHFAGFARSCKQMATFIKARTYSQIKDYSQNSMLQRRGCARRWRYQMRAAGDGGLSEPR